MDADSTSAGGGHRRARVARATRETDIVLALDLDGAGRAEVDTPVGFLTHMLEALARHALIDIDLRVRGDVEVDLHHTVEDTGLVLGQAIAEALGERRGIARAGWARHPMDEALAEAAVDLSGRPCLVLEAAFAGTHVGELPLELLHDFFEALARTLGAAIHLDVVRGRSDHHKVEALFKALARALRMAIAREPRLGDAVPSTKGAFDLGHARGGAASAARSPRSTGADDAAAAGAKAAADAPAGLDGEGR